MSNSPDLLQKKILGDSIFACRPSFLPDDPIDQVYGDVDFDEFFPIILIDKANSGSTNVNRTRIYSLNLKQISPEATAPIHVAVVRDSIARYSSGGLSVTPYGLRPGWSSAHKVAEAACYYGSPGAPDPSVPELAAIALSANARVIEEYTFDAVLGYEVDLVFDGVASINLVGSIAVYAWTEDPGFVVPHLKWSALIEEEKLPT